MDGTGHFVRHGCTGGDLAMGGGTILGGYRDWGLGIGQVWVCATHMEDDLRRWMGMELGGMRGRFNSEGVATIDPATPD